ncbi:MAG: hypothetical protein H6742_11800 [Alphaproteobacteria bacterium]|nr:hypothetical protein [Alphaproteobacteria bacterium]
MAQDPAALARLGRTQLARGHDRVAVTTFEQAVALRRDRLAEAPADIAFGLALAAALIELAAARKRVGPRARCGPLLDEACGLAHDAHERLRRWGQPDAADRAGRLLSVALGERVDDHLHAGRAEAAAPLLDALRALPPATSSTRAQDLQRVGRLRELQGDLAGAEVALREAADAWADGQHADTARLGRAATLERLAALRIARGQDPLPLLDEVLALRRPDATPHPTRTALLVRSLLLRHRSASPALPSPHAAEALALATRLAEAFPSARAQRLLRAARRAASPAPPPR